MKLNLIIIETSMEKKFHQQKFSDLPISRKSQLVNIDEILFPFHPISLYATALSLMDSIYPRIETSCVSSRI